MDALEHSDISLEVRVKEGRYKVTVPVSSKKGIETVTSSGTLVKLAQRVGGKKGAKEETKVIMDGVNLFLEEGKMYLILGAPDKQRLLNACSRI